MEKPMDLWTKIGIALGVLTIVVDKFIVKLPDVLAIVLYAAAVILIVYGSLNSYRSKEK